MPFFVIVVEGSWEREGGKAGPAAHSQAKQH